MGVETSNMKTKPSGQSNMVNAKGKRKEESVELALSLQDVFSDSANLAGRQQKTSCRPKPNGGNPTQLEGKEKKKVKKVNVGGRKKLPIIQLKSKKLQMHVTAQEYSNFQVLLKASGKKTISDFMRVLVLNEKKNHSIINNVALIAKNGIIPKLATILMCAESNERLNNSLRNCK